MLFVIIIIIFFAMVAIGITKSFKRVTVTECGGRIDPPRPYFGDEDVEYNPDPVYRENMQQAMQEFSLSLREAGKAFSQLGMHPLILDIGEVESTPEEEHEEIEIKPLTIKQKPKIRRIRI